MRTFTIGGEKRTRDLDETFQYSSPYRFRLCGGGTRVAVWMRDEEHDWRHLILADAETGAVVEHFDDIAPEYGGSIELCRDGTRIVYQDPETDRLWRYRDHTPDGWLDTGPVPTGFEAEDDDAEPDADVTVTCRVAASPDGTTVVMAGTREEERRRRTTYSTRAEVWHISPDDDEAVPREVTFQGVEIPTEPRIAVSNWPVPLAAFHDRGRTVVVDLTTGLPVADVAIPKWKADPSNYREDGVLFSDNGRRLVAYAGKRVFAWDVSGGAAVELTAGGACAPAVSPDGRTIATVDEKGVVRFFDAATGAPGVTIQPPGPTLVGVQYASPAGLSFSADGTMCLVGYSNGFVAIWDVE